MKLHLAVLLLAASSSAAAPGRDDQKTSQEQAGRRPLLRSPSAGAPDAPSIVSISSDKAGKIPSTFDHEDVALVNDLMADADDYPDDCYDQDWASHGMTCEYFETAPEACEYEGDMPGFDGRLAKDVCCACQGTGAATTTSATTHCEDYPNWEDENTATCMWYNIYPEDCETNGYRTGTDGKSPNEACCICKMEMNNHHYHFGDDCIDRVSDCPPEEMGISCDDYDPDRVNCCSCGGGDWATPTFSTSASGATGDDCTDSVPEFCSSLVSEETGFHCDNYASENCCLCGGGIWGQPPKKDITITEDFNAQKMLH